MTSFEIPKNLEVKFINDEIGYGVFTQEKVKKGETVEFCYCLEFNEFISHFLDYLFVHPKTEKTLLVFGYGTIYNHNSDPNIRWEEVKDNTKFIRFVAIRDISEGEELTHNYGDLYWKSRKNKLI